LIENYDFDEVSTAFDPQYIFGRSNRKRGPLTETGPRPSGFRGVAGDMMLMPDFEICTSPSWYCPSLELREVKGR